MIWGNEALSHLLVAFIYFFIVSVLRLVTGGALGGLGLLGILGMWLGAFLGTYVLDIDHVIYWFFTNPDKEDSREAREIMTAGSIKSIKGIVERLKKLYFLLQRVHCSHTKLIFHTAFFQIILLGIGLFLILSENNIFGLAFILSINLHLLKDEWFDYVKKGESTLNNWLFWQYPKFDDVKYLKLYLIIVTGFFIFLTYNFLNG